MKLKSQLPISRLIAKIDNDFNLSESDWIPRVAAWTIDALSQLNVLPKEKKRRTLEVSDGIAQFPCTLDVKEIKVFDKYGNEIKSAEQSKCNTKYNQKCPTSEIIVTDSGNKVGMNYMHVANIIENKNFVINGNQIDLSFDTDEIIVESLEVATYYDEYYDCNCPYIIDDGLLLEALAWYCLFKYLSRGSKHPVYDLKSPNPAINPFMQWNALRVKAANSAKKAMSNNIGDGWNNFFYNSTFLPRS